MIKLTACQSLFKSKPISYHILMRSVHVWTDAVSGCKDPASVDHDRAAEKTERVEQSDMPRARHCWRLTSAHTAFYSVKSRLQKKQILKENV